MKAFLIVDLQKDFCPGGALAVPEGDKIVPIINKMMGEFDLVVASKDWHPEETVHFENWPEHCQQGTEGAKFHPELDLSKINMVFLKGTGNKDDGYSAFEATNLDLTTYLKENNIDELYISGLATEYCVKETALSALREDFKVYLVEKATAGIDAEDVKNAIEELKKAGVKLI